MSLPKIIAPEYEVKLFSVKQPVRFRPYLVKEEKLLLMAQNGNDPKEIENAVRQIARNCTFDKINADTLPSFDLEYLFLQLRGKSVNNIIELRLVCQNPVASTTEQKTCGALIQKDIDIDDIKLTVPDGHTDLIALSDSITVQMKYPTATVESDQLLELLPHCIKLVMQKVISDATAVYEVTNVEEAKEFVDNLTVAQVDKLRVFFDTMPHMEYTFTFQCNKCGYEEPITLKGLQDFFG